MLKLTVAYIELVYVDDKDFVGVIRAVEEKNTARGKLETNIVLQILSAFAVSVLIATLGFCSYSPPGIQKTIKTNSATMFIIRDSFLVSKINKR